MNFEEWLALSDSERLASQAEWQPYVDGYWHELVAEAANRLRTDIGYLPHVLDINFGVYHGGTLILGVVTDLKYPQVLELPSSYLGFPLMQFCRATRT